MRRHHHFDQGLSGILEGINKACSALVAAGMLCISGSCCSQFWDCPLCSCWPELLQAVILAIQGSAYECLLALRPVTCGSSSAGLHLRPPHTNTCIIQPDPCKLPQVLELPSKGDKIVDFAWEPHGTRFAVLHGEGTKPSLSLYNMKDMRTSARGVQLVATQPNKQVNGLQWSPQVGLSTALAWLGMAWHEVVNVLAVCRHLAYVQRQHNCTSVEAVSVMLPSGCM